MGQSSTGLGNEKVVVVVVVVVLVVIVIGKKISLPLPFKF
jgi:hypothetical protein